MNLEALLKTRTDLLLDALESEERHNYLLGEINLECAYQDFLESVLSEIEEQIAIERIVQLCLTGK